MPRPRPPKKLQTQKMFLKVTKLHYAVAPLVWVPWVPWNPLVLEHWVPEPINFGDKQVKCNQISVQNEQKFGVRNLSNIWEPINFNS